MTSHIYMYFAEKNHKKQAVVPKILVVTICACHVRAMYSTATKYFTPVGLKAHSMHLHLF